MNKTILLPFILLIVSACNSEDIANISNNTVDDTNVKNPSSLAKRINDYRVEQGLQTIPVSTSLTMVAEFHVNDLERTNPSGNCNLHSWSTQGSWSACCYTGDHAQAQCMWNKPREITAGLYQGNGYEISAQNSGQMTSNGALEQWKGSVLHHDVILNRGLWVNSNWKAIGAAVSNHYAVVWFGTESDPAGSP